MPKENDIVLIHFEGKPLSFARVEKIVPDSKADWYHVKLLILQVPLQVVTWILKDSYINGAEFTMDGKAMRMEHVVCPDDHHAPEALKEGKKPPRKPVGGKVISLADMKKKE